MKERPILFSGPMVRALLAGTKTQTRRAHQLQPVDPHHLRVVGPDGTVHYTRPAGDPLLDEARSTPGYRVLTCAEWLAEQGNRYGKPGDRLWVREAWGYFDPDGQGQDFEAKNDDGGNGPCKVYAPELMQEGHALRDFWRRRIAYSATWQDPRYGSGPDKPARWRPSIHMPRWARRILLEVVAVRVERLQDISAADAMAEGAPPSHPSIDRVSHEFGYADFSRSWYAQLWQQINGAGSWDANPWVWVVEFKRLPS